MPKVNVLRKPEASFAENKFELREAGLLNLQNYHIGMLIYGEIWPEII